MGLAGVYEPYAATSSAQAIWPAYLVLLSHMHLLSNLDICVWATSEPGHASTRASEAGIQVIAMLLTC